MAFWGDAEFGGVEAKIGGGAIRFVVAIGDEVLEDHRGADDEGVVGLPVEAGDAVIAVLE